MARQTTYP